MDGRSSRVSARVELRLMYVLPMINERLQILVTVEQRRRLTAEAQRRRSSVASRIREAIDERFGPVERGDRIRAAEEIAAMRGRFLPPDELDVLAESEKAAVLPPSRSHR